MRHKRIEIFDFAQYRNAVITDQGFMKVPIRATRVGVFKYYTADGSLTRELRLPEEVFSEESMASLASVPITDQHPKEMVNAKNAKRHTIGFTGEKVEKVDNFFLDVNGIITHDEAIKRAMAKGAQEVSCGYTADIEMSSGVFNGETYDAIQRNIRYNHVALVDKGRAGPDVKLRLDEHDAVLYNENINLDKSEDKSMKVKIGDKEYEMSDEAGKAVMDFMKKKDEEMKKLKGDKEGMEKEKKDALEKVETTTKELDKAQAKADSLEAENTSLKEEVKKSEEKMDSKQIHELVKERKELESAAKKILGDEEKMDELDNMEIKKKVVAKALPNVKVEEKSDEYINTSFETLTNIEVKADHLAEIFNKKEEENEDEKKDSLTPEQELQIKTEESYKNKI